MSNLALFRRPRLPVSNRIFDSDVGEMFSEMNKLMQSMQSSLNLDVMNQNRNYSLQETEDAYELEIEMPGLGEEDIDISLSDNILSISGRKELSADESKDDKEQGKVQRRSQVSYTFNLDRQINSENIHAEFDKGILNISLPKAEESKPKKIEIAKSSKQ